MQPVKTPKKSQTEEEEDHEQEQEHMKGHNDPVLATWDIRSKNGRFCFSFLRFLEAVACTDKGMQEDFVCLHP
jgi:hypothetical protein